MWGRAHPQGNVALPLVWASRFSPAWLAAAALHRNLWEWQLWSTAYLSVSEWGLVDGQSCKHLPPLSGIIHSFSFCDIALLLCIHLGRLAASLARGGVGGEEGPYFTMAVQLQCINRATANGLRYSWCETSVCISPTCRISEVSVIVWQVRFIVHAVDLQ